MFFLRIGSHNVGSSFIGRFPFYNHTPVNGNRIWAKAIFGYANLSYFRRGYLVNRCWLVITNQDADEDCNNQHAEAYYYRRPLIPGSACAWYKRFYLFVRSM